MEAITLSNGITFKVNDIVAYKKGDSVQLGKIKRLTDNGAFVWYSTGDTASLTPYHLLLKVENAYCIDEHFCSCE